MILNFTSLSEFVKHSREISHCNVEVVEVDEFPAEHLESRDTKLKLDEDACFIREIEVKNSIAFDCT